MNLIVVNQLDFKEDSQDWVGDIGTSDPPVQFETGLQGRLSALINQETLPYSVSKGLWQTQACSEEEN